MINKIEFEMFIYDYEEDDLIIAIDIINERLGEKSYFLLQREKEIAINRLKRIKKELKNIELEED